MARSTLATSAHIREIDRADGGPTPADATWPIEVQARDAVEVDVVLNGR